MITKNVDKDENIQYVMKFNLNGREHQKRKKNDIMDELFVYRSYDTELLNLLWEIYSHVEFNIESVLKVNLLEIKGLDKIRGLNETFNFIRDYKENYKRVSNIREQLACKS